MYLTFEKDCIKILLVNRERKSQTPERTNNEEEYFNDHLLHGRFSGDLLAVRLEDKGYRMDAYVLGCSRCWRGWCNAQRSYKFKENQREVKDDEV